MKLFLMLIAVLGAVVVQAQDFPPSVALRPEYRIQAGDQLDVKLFYHPELDESITVRPDGRVSLQLVNEVAVEGMTAQQFSELLTAVYGKQLKMADTAVIVRSFSGQKIYMDGEVGHPGVLNLPANMTLLQALAESGGIKETGRLKNVLIIRKTEDGKPQVLRVDALYASATTAPDILLRPYDVVFIPRSRIANVNLWVDQYIRKNIPITFGILSNGFLP